MQIPIDRLNLILKWCDIIVETTPLPLMITSPTVSCECYRARATTTLRAPLPPPHLTHTNFFKILIGLKYEMRYYQQKNTYN